MNRLVLITAVFFMSIGSLAAQSADSSNVKKKKDYTVFGKTWYYEKYNDGTSSWQFETEEHNNYVSNNKPSKFSSDLEVDLGLNLWSPTDNAPQVKPWGSWNVNLNMVGTYKASKNFHLKTGIGASFYNFKLEDTDLIAVKTPSGISFEEFTEGRGTKSKISASYANISLVPTILTNDGKLRLGIGGYAGVRLGGRGKFVYDDASGDQQKIFEKSNMYASNFRYGGRAELGVGDFDLFFNYDFNELFESGKGPKLNAISFGVIFN
ncbi:hypothetical protein [Algoriphagus marinus]|uniref:hypothetical protein n=1 Tax=Algoriphagus marinus TaxID=1925762 RepID=UPI00094BC0D6|nr:hypothetical protein [Algoriphagus marinus]